MNHVVRYLQGHGIACEALAHRETFTSAAEARALGIDADEVAKTVLVSGAHGYALVVIPASRHVDMALVRAALSDASVELASEMAIERSFPEFELGALPPIQALLGVPIIVDPEVMRHERIVFAAGDRNLSVSARTVALFATQTTAVARVAEDDRVPVGAHAT